MRRFEILDPRGRIWAIEAPTTRRERMLGLRGRPGLAPHHAMWIDRCRSVHTFGMRFPIEVVFIDAGWRVVAVRKLPPGRLAYPRLRARSVLECEIGSNLAKGDVLRPS